MSAVEIKTIIPLYEARVISYKQPNSEPREMRVAEGWAAIIKSGPNPEDIDSATIYYDHHGLYRGFVDMDLGSFEFIWSPHTDINPEQNEKDVSWDMDDEFVFLFLEYLNYKQTR